MQIITDISESKVFANNLSLSLADATYWKDWSLMDITATPPLDWIKQAKVTALIRSQLSDDDGSIFWLSGSVLAVFQNRLKNNLENFPQTLEKALGLPAQVLTLSIAGEIDNVKRLLARRQGVDDTPKEVSPANYHDLKALVPNIDALLEEWHKEKKVREGRSKPHIMIVDDDPMTLRLVSRALERDYEVIAAQNGAEAIAKHLQLMPDIIFLDIGLPDCDGLTLLNYMQQYDTECRIVMFSADDFLKTKVRAFAGGAHGFLPKPFNLRSFQKQIAEWFSAEKGSES